MHFNDIRIPASDMAAAAFLTPNANLEHHALCLYAASSGPFPSLSKDNIDEFREHMRVPARCAAMGGEHTVFIYQFKTFQGCNISAAQREGFVVTGGVTYYDDVIHTGEMDPGFWNLGGLSGSASAVI